MLGKFLAFVCVWLHCVTCGILISPPRVEQLWPFTVRVLSPNHWSTKEFPGTILNQKTLLIYYRRNRYIFRDRSVSVNFCRSVAKWCSTETPWTAACQALLSFTVSRNLLRFMSIESVLLSNHLIVCCPLLFPSVSPGSFLMSHIFSSGGQSIGASASASVLSMNIQS